MSSLHDAESSDGSPERYASNVLSSEVSTSIKPLVPVDRFSSFRKLLGTYTKVLLFIRKLKLRIGKDVPSDSCYNTALSLLIKSDQLESFPDVVRFFDKRNTPIKDTPNLIFQLNLYMDSSGIIRMKSKFDKYHPILVSHSSPLVKLIILDVHLQCSHAGLYTVLREVRKTFWILRGFSVVRRLLKSCVTCRRVNERPIKLNQNDYRSFRSDPPKVPFSSIFVDYIGPMIVKMEGKRKKVWLLIVTCMWSRAVSLQICLSADTPEFLRSLQIHVYSYGLFSLCLSDLGSQIVSGSRIIRNFLDDSECYDFFQRNGISRLTFDQYAKGNSSLGSIVESVVKQTKSLINKSIGKRILDYSEFQLLISKTVHVINRRPIAFKDVLRDSVREGEVPTAITPEMLIYGREIIAIDIIPQMHPGNLVDPDFHSDKDYFRDSFSNLKASNEKLRDVYHGEFLVNLVNQATDKRDRYKPANHKKLSVGDLVLLVEPHTKQCNYPMGIVRKANVNSLGEVTSAVILKGDTGEEVFRHSTSLILLLSPDEVSEDDADENEEVKDFADKFRPVRKCAIEARKKISNLAENSF